MARQEPTQIDGLTRLSNGEWFDPHNRVTLSPNHSKVKRAQEKLQEQEELDRAERMARMPYDERRADREQQGEQLKRQAQQVAQNYGPVMERIGRLRAQAAASIPEGFAGDRSEAIDALLAQNGEYLSLAPIASGMRDFVQKNRGIIDPNAMAPAPAPQAGDADISTFATQAGQTIQSQQGGSDPRAELARLQGMLTGTNRDEREESARALGIHSQIRELHNRANPPNERPNPRFTADQIGVSPAVEDPRTGQEVQGLTPQQRGFIEQPDGTFAPGSSLGGIPGLGTYQQMEEQGRAPQAYAGDRFTGNAMPRPAPEGFSRQVTGNEDGSFQVMDTRREQDAPRFGVFERADGTVSGMGADGDRHGFANEQEAIEWSKANFAPSNPQSGASPILTGGQQTVQPTRERQPFSERFQEQGLIGGRDAAIPGAVLDGLETAGVSQANPQNQGDGGFGHPGNASGWGNILFGRRQEQPFTPQGPSEVNIAGTPGPSNSQPGSGRICSRGSHVRRSAQ